MKIGVAGCYHETNTFAPGFTSIEDFKREWVEGKQQFYKWYEGTKTSMGGVIDASTQFGFELVPLIYMQTMPSSLVTKEAEQQIIDSIKKQVKTSYNQLDGLILILHGAMVSEISQDVEGKIIQEVKKIVGDLPIAVTVDLHANISEQMVELSEFIVGYDTYPHIDAYERAVEASRLLVQTVNNEITPVSILAKTDLLIAPMMLNTNIYPMKLLMEMAFVAEEDERVLNITVAGGFAFADVFCAGTTIIVTTNNDAELAQQIADDLVEWVKQNAESFKPKLHPVDNALQSIQVNKKLLTIVIESSDNVGGGSPGDATHVLRHLIEKSTDLKFLMVICDETAVKKAIKIGVGNSFHESIGGKMDEKNHFPTLHGDPVEVKGKVRTLFDGQYVHKGPYMAGMNADMGKTALISLPDYNDSTIILTEKRVAPWDVNHVLSVGINPESYDLINVKASVAWRSAFGDMACEAIEVDTPGCCSSNLNHFTFKNLDIKVQILSANY